MGSNKDHLPTRVKSGRVLEDGRGYDVGFATAWGKAKATIKDLNEEAGDDKAFRLMVLAAFLPDEG